MVFFVSVWKFGCSLLAFELAKKEEVYDCFRNQTIWEQIDKISGPHFKDKKHEIPIEVSIWMNQKLLFVWFKNNMSFKKTPDSISPKTGERQKLISLHAS